MFSVSPIFNDGADSLSDNNNHEELEEGEISQSSPSPTFISPPPTPDIRFIEERYSRLYYLFYYQDEFPKKSRFSVEEIENLNFRSFNWLLIDGLRNKIQGFVHNKSETPYNDDRLKSLLKTLFRELHADLPTDEATVFFSCYLQHLIYYAGHVLDKKDPKVFVSIINILMKQTLFAEVNNKIAIWTDPKEKNNVLLAINRYDIPHSVFKKLLEKLESTFRSHPKQLREMLLATNIKKFTPLSALLKTESTENIILFLHFLAKHLSADEFKNLLLTVNCEDKPLLKYFCESDKKTPALPVLLKILSQITNSKDFFNFLNQQDRHGPALQRTIYLGNIEATKTLLEYAKMKAGGTNNSYFAEFIDLARYIDNSILEFVAHSSLSPKMKQTMTKLLKSYLTPQPSFAKSTFSFSSESANRKRKDSEETIKSAKKTRTSS